MVAELNEALDKLKLTAEEEEILGFEEDVDEEKADQIALNLINKAAVMNEGPWTFDGYTLLLKELTGMEKYSEVVFDTTRFWVKVYDVPALKQTRAFAEFIANKVGKFVTVDKGNLVGIDKSLNFIVDININKPLRRGIRVKIGTQPVWFDIRYVKLSDFYYPCGMLGHVYRGCEGFDDSIPDDKLPYGPNMQASLIASKRKGREAAIQEERQLLQAFKDRRSNKKAKMKLMFNGIEEQGVDAGPKGAEGGEGERSMKEVLDQFCAQSEWSALFPAAKVFHIDSDFSDHLPIF
ncbi:hypothetical protein Cgig2_016521 [Carnegiea gigantea]|uniref:Zinc knuckle CX2CX4HX4C domain-containing protein n=1 Tax=Carnegiea gigantea TaxID=171969 RepID=A0A9Q1Q9U3_9CARY|nr:hypothetical protein Cgig2_016521 [Carnegiea gigantea]